MVTPAVADAIKSIRIYAWSVSPEFGSAVDRELLQSQGLGDGDTTDPLTDLSKGLAQLANAANLSVNQYLDARTRVNQAIAASNAGLTTAQAADNQRATAGTVNPATANVLGVPLWLLFIGGAAILLATRK